MAENVGRPIAIIVVEIPQVGQVPVRFSEKDLVHFVQSMQRGFLERYDAMREPPHFPLFEVIDTGVGHGEAQTGLWVATAQSGVWGLHGSREALTKMKQQIDRAIELMDARSKPAN